MQTAQIINSRLFNAHQVINGHFCVGSAFCNLDNQILRTFPSEITCFTSYEDHFFVVFGTKLAIFKNMEDPVVYEIPSDLKANQIQVSKYYIAIATEFPEITFQIYELQQSKIKRLISLSIPFLGTQAEPCEISIINNNFLLSYQSQAFHILLQKASQYWYGDVLPVLPGQFINDIKLLPIVEESMVLEKQNDNKQSSIVTSSANFRSVDLNQNVNFLKQTTASHLEMEEDDEASLQLLKIYCDGSNNLVETPDLFSDEIISQNVEKVKQNIKEIVTPLPVTDGRRYFELLRELKIQNLKHSFCINNVTIEDNKFVIADRLFGIIVIPELIPPQQNQNILHPISSISYVLNTKFSSILTYYYAGIFGFVNGKVMQKEQEYQGDDCINQITMYNDRILVISDKSCGYLSEKNEYEKLYDLKVARLPKAAEHLPEFMKYILAQKYNLYNFDTPNCDISGRIYQHQAVISHQDALQVQDPVLSSAECNNLLVSGHASGYIRIFSTFQGKAKLLQKIRLSSVGILRLSLNQQFIVASDAAGVIFFVSGIEKEFTVLGYCNIGEFAGVSKPFGEYIDKCSQIDYSIVQSGSIEISNSLSSRILNPSEQQPQQAEQLKQFYFQAHQLTDIMPISAAGVRNNIYYSIIDIKLCKYSVYVALSNGNIMKLNYPSNERILTQVESSQVLKLADMRETLQVSSQRELEMLETRFLDISRQNIIQLAELQPKIIKTGLSISSLLVDECAVPPPLVLSDFLYVGLTDGRLFLFMVKTEGVDEGNSRIDLPILQKPLLQMHSAVCQLSSKNGIISAIDDSGFLAIFQAPHPLLSYLKKIALLCQKNDEVVQQLIPSEIFVPEIKLDFAQQQINNKSQSIVIDVQSNSLTLQLFSPGSSCLVEDKDTFFAEVYQRKGESYRIRLPSQFAADCLASQQELEQFVKQFVMAQLQQNDANQLSKQQLKHQYERRNAVIFPPSDDSVLQIISSVPEMSEFSTEHAFYQQIYQHFRYMMKCHVAASQGPLSIQESLQSNVVSRKAALALEECPGTLEIAFAKTPLAIAAKISSALRLRLNEKLIEESQKLAESLQEIDRQNEQVIKDKNFTIVARNTCIERLESRAAASHGNSLPNDNQGQVSTANELKATHYLPENAIHCSQRAVNLQRANFFKYYAQYERAYKGDIMKAKALLDYKEKQIFQNAGEAVAGLLDKRTYVAGFAYKQRAASKKQLILRTAQTACSLFEAFQVCAFVKNANGQMTSPNTELEQQPRNISVFKSINTYQQKTDGSGYFEALSNFGMELPQFAVPGMQEYVAQPLQQIYRCIPPVRAFMLPQLSLQQAIFAESEVISPVKAKQQARLLGDVVQNICSESNSQLIKTRDLKYRNISKIQEIAQQIRDIGKELVYHAKEETLTALINSNFARLLEQYKLQGLAIEECSARAAKNCILALPQDDQVLAQAMEKVDLRLLDFSAIISAAEETTGSESVERAIGYNIYKQEDLQNELQRLSGPAAFERAYSAVQQGLFKIQQDEPTKELQQCLGMLTDQGQFEIVDLRALLHQERAKLTESSVHVSDKLLRVALAYKRALYEMMRGSIDAANKQTIRDVAIPSVLGLAKLSKEQEAAVDAYRQKLQEIDERRAKEKKQLAAMCAKLREQAGEICRQFDAQTLKQVRERRFKDEILVQAIQLQQTSLNNYAVQKSQFQRFQEQTDYQNNQLEVAQKELGTHSGKAQEALKQRAEKHTLYRQLSKHIDVQRKQLFTTPDLQHFFQVFRLNYQQVKEQIKATFSKQIVQKQGLSYQQIISCLEVIYQSCQQFSKEQLSETVVQVQKYEKDLLNKFADNITILYSNEPVIPIQSSYERLNNILQQPPVYNVFYIQLISKLFPIQQLPDFAQLTTKPNFQSQEMILFDVCRCVKTLLELILYDSNSKLLALQNHEIYAQYLIRQYDYLIDNNIKLQQSNADLINTQFLNPAIIAIFKQGQVENYRQWDMIFDKKKLQFMKKDVVTEEANNQTEYQPNLLIKDDSSYQIVDVAFIKQINQILADLGEQRINKLISMSKFRQKQEILNHTIQQIQYKQKDFAAQTKDFQLIRVSKDMYNMIRDNISINAKKAKEVSVVQRKLDHSRQAYEVEDNEYQARLMRIPAQLTQINKENMTLQDRIDELEALNAQRKQALPEFAVDAERAERETQDEALQKFRRIAALRKMRELSKAQEEEMQFLIEELEKLRNRTYPSFQ